VLAVPALAIMLAGGARAAPLGVMLLIASGGHLLGFTIDWKRSLVVVVLVLLLVPTMMNLRSFPIREWTPDLVVQAVTNQVENSRSYQQSPLEALLVSNSTSYQTLAGTMLFVPDVEPFRYGMDYFRAIGMAVPFGHVIFSAVGIELAEGEPSDWLKARISPTTWAGLGYLQVAEAYLQFGTYGVIGLYVLLGVIITSLWRRIQREPLDPRFLALILLLMMALLIWVRNESIALTRPLIWGWLLIYVLPALLDMHRSRRMAQRLLQGGARHRPAATHVGQQARPTDAGV
jgi:hypothetical protein